MFKSSVIICTHNPRPDFLKRVLSALQAQTLPKEQWELLLIDNASKEPLAASWNLSWHPHARHIREEELGLTPARLRGIRECDSELLVFVDDDNILTPDYLAQSFRIASDWPVIGAFGGHIEPEFEISPPEWSRPFWIYLAIREVRSSQWSNDADSTFALPCGAGMIIRKCVAEHYREKCGKAVDRIHLGRKGTSLASAEDTDLILTGHEMGFGRGLFPELKMTHLVPKRRLSEEYFGKLLFSMASSTALLSIIRGKSAKEIRGGKIGFVRFCRSLLTTNGRQRRFALARWRGTRHGLALAAELNKQNLNGNFQIVPNHNTAA